MTTGWRYSVRIPDYTKEDTQGEDVIVYFQVDVLVQSPGAAEPATPATVWRRFSEFRQLHTNLKNAFPDLFKNKELDPPPKKSLRFVNNSDRLLNERRQRLEAWLWALMSYREVAQSREMRAFLQLHLAVRAATSSGSLQSTSSENRIGELRPEAVDDREIVEGEIDTVSEVSGPSVITTISNVPTDAMSLGMPTRSQLGEATDALRMGLRVEQRSDLKKLLEIITKYVDQAGRDIQDASSEVSRLQQANRELFERVHSLEPQAQGEPSSQEVATNDLQKALRERDNSLEEAQLRIQELEVSVSTSEAQRAVLESRLIEVTQLQKEIGKEDKDKVQDLEKELAEARKKCGKLEEELAAWKKKYKEDNKKLAEAIRSLRSEKQALSVQVAELEESHSTTKKRMEETMEGLRFELGTLEKKLSKEQEQRSALEAERAGQIAVSLDTTTEIKRQLDEERQAFSSRLNAMKEACEQANNDRAVALQDLEDTTVKMKEDKTNLEARLAEEATKHRELEEEVAVLRECSQEAEELETLKKQHEEVCAARTQLEEQLVQKDHMGEELARVRQEFEGLQAQHRSLIAEKDVAKISQEELRAVKDQMEEHQKQIELLDSENGILRTEISKSGQTSKDLEVFKTENKTLRDQLMQYKQEEGELKRLKGVMESLAAENAQLNAFKNELQTDMADLKATAEERAQDMARLMLENESLRAADEQSKSLSTEVERLNAQFRDIAVDNGKLIDSDNGRTDILVAEIEKLKAQNKVLLGQNKASTSREVLALKQSLEEVDAMKTQLAESRKVAADLGEQKEALEREREELVAARKQANEALLEAQAEAVQAVNKATQLQSLVEQLGTEPSDQVQSSTDSAVTDKLSDEVRGIFSDLLGCDVSGWSLDGSLDAQALDGYLERVGQSNGQLSVIECKTRELRSGESGSWVNKGLQVVFADVLDELAKKYKRINEITVQRLLSSVETSSMPTSLENSSPQTGVQQTRSPPRVQSQRSWNRVGPGQPSLESTQSARSAGSSDGIGQSYRRLPGQTISSGSTRGGDEGAPFSPDAGTRSGGRGFWSGLSSKVSQGTGFMNKMSNSFISRVPQSTQQQRQLPPHSAQHQGSPGAGPPSR